MPGHDPLVSVIIPNHDYARYVGEAVDSALAQTHPSIEVVVVDNGSSDASLEVLAAYGDRIRVIAQRDLGQAGGRNRGILEARGELLAFLDADDVWLPNKIARQVAVFAARGPGLGLVYCSMQRTDADLAPIDVLPAVWRGSVLDEFARLPGAAIVLGGESTAVVTREAIVRAGIFDPSLSIGSGWDLWRRIATLYEIDFVAEPLVLYRQHGSNLHARLDAYERDQHYMSTKMFADPSAVSTRRHRRRFLAGIDLMMAKSFAAEGNRGRAAMRAGRAFARDPIGTLRRRRP